MRILILALATLALTISPTRAQVTIDLRALDALPLPGSRPVPQQATPQTRPPEPRRTTSSQATSPVTPSLAPQVAAPQAISPSGVPTVTAPTREAALPIVTPPAAEVAPIPAAPAPTGEPPPPPVSAASTTRASESPAGMRLTFDAASTDLSTASMDAIRRFIGSTSSRDSTTFNVMAYAAGKADDPSVARRISLSRALAVRSALIAEGIASSRIFVRALGAQGGGGPPDRVDVSLLGTNATP